MALLLEDREMKREPVFSNDQIVTSTDVVRRWRDQVEPKLNKHPYVMVFNSNRPRATVMRYEHFESLWRKAQEASELELQLELLARLIYQQQSNKPLKTLAEVVEDLGITQEDLEAVGDVEIETD